MTQAPIVGGHQNVLDAMRLFADRVMPKFQ